MKKSDFVSLVFAVIGGFLFSIGMCMCLVVEWNMFRPGVVVTAVGSAALLVLALVRWNKAGRPTVHVNGKTLGRVLLGAAGALTLGIGVVTSMFTAIFVTHKLLDIFADLGIKNQKMFVR